MSQAHRQISFLLKSLVISLKCVIISANATVEKIWIDVFSQADFVDFWWTQGINLK